MPSDLKTNALLRAKQLEDNRLNWEGEWKDITTYIVPEHGRYTGDQANTRKTSGTNVVHETAGQDLDLLASGMQSGLTSPATPWFNITLKDERFLNNSAVQAWIDSVEKIFYNAFKSSNFYGQIKALYKELAAFGTGAIYQEENYKFGFVFHVFTTGSYAIGVGEDGLVDSIYRTFWMPARTIAKKWPGRISTAIENAAKASGTPDKFYEICHLIYPRESYDPTKKDNQNMPFASLYWEKGASEPGKDFLEQSGYWEFPVFVPRWDVAAEDVYGQGPGQKALASVKMLQQFFKGGVVGLHKAIEAAVVKAAGMKGRLDRNPGGETPVASPSTADAIKRIDDIDMNALTVLAKYFIEETKQLIHTAFYKDLFRKVSDRDEMMKATVANALERERLQEIGGVITGLEHELLDPLFERTFNCLLRAGKIPSPPPELSGQALDMDYLGRLSQAQKQTGAIDMETVTQYVGAVSQLAPSAIDNFDPDAAVQAYAKMFGVPIGVIRAQDVLQQIREMKAIEAQQAMELQQQVMAAKGMKDEAAAAKMMEGAA